MTSDDARALTDAINSLSREVRWFAEALTRGPVPSRSAGAISGYPTAPPPPERPAPRTPTPDETQEWPAMVNENLDELPLDELTEGEAECKPKS